ncbi:hypothetical protein MP638_005621 [Amoeboaphelidium occidentale]|nr:hypothetical protein MP638_005621 [Amoeboaphelidium occidentale]
MMTLVFDDLRDDLLRKHDTNICKEFKSRLVVYALKVVHVLNQLKGATDVCFWFGLRDLVRFLHKSIRVGYIKDIDKELLERSIDLIYTVEDKSNNMVVMVLTHIVDITEESQAKIKMDKMIFITIEYMKLLDLSFDSIITKMNKLLYSYKVDYSVCKNILNAQEDDFKLTASNAIKAALEYSLLDTKISWKYLCSFLTCLYHFETSENHSELLVSFMQKYQLFELYFTEKKNRKFITLFLSKSSQNVASMNALYKAFKKEFLLAAEYLREEPLVLQLLCHFCDSIQVAFDLAKESVAQFMLSVYNDVWDLDIFMALSLKFQKVKLFQVSGEDLIVYKKALLRLRDAMVTNAKEKMTLSSFQNYIRQFAAFFSNLPEKSANFLDIYGFLMTLSSFQNYIRQFAAFFSNLPEKPANFLDIYGFLVMFDSIAAFQLNDEAVMATLSLLLQDNKVFELVLNQVLTELRKEKYYRNVNFNENVVSYTILKGYPLKRDVPNSRKKLLIHFIYGRSSLNFNPQNEESWKREQVPQKDSVEISLESHDRCFNMNRSLLSNLSPVFHAMLEGHFSEASKSSIKMTESPIVLEYFCKFVNTFYIPSSLESTDFEAAEWIKTVIKNTLQYSEVNLSYLAFDVFLPSYNFGEKFMIPSFKKISSYGLWYMIHVIDGESEENLGFYLKLFFAVYELERDDYLENTLLLVARLIIQDLVSMAFRSNDESLLEDILDIYDITLEDFEAVYVYSIKKHFSPQTTSISPIPQSASQPPSSSIS